MASPSGNEPLLAAAPPVPAPVVVVSPQFCAKEVVPLTVTKKAKSLTGGDFAVTDPSGAVVLQFKGSVWSVRNRRVLVDAAGQPILSMHEKVLSMHNRWEVFRGDSSNASDLLFTVKRSTLLQLRTELEVFLAGNNTAQQACDFKLKGSYFDRDCAFYLGDSNTMIAQISRKYTASNVLLGKDTFNVTVFPDVDHVFVAVLVVVLDEVHSRDRNY
ncbi:hypothetical protein SETIT_2G089500v2 [Setaria italica]|uniref:Protein LURP-one-related 15 n=1 Tax=Setaria italica TaxID=4555 RepID=K4A269_SETIT|nr:protein LURP-one-related 15 [Setaria italica]RCV10151.1 hypothetical protein SETIT_2G089500v2 [Setaria italica]